MVRRTLVSGQFYEASKELLRNQVKECLGKVPKPSNDVTYGVISPHAGYYYSGKCAGYSYRAIAESKKPDTYIMLGLSHSGYPSCISNEEYETPLGIVKSDKELITELSKNIPINDTAHANEHSIEVQIPFLQCIDKDAIIAPIIVGHDVTNEARYIYDAIKKFNRKVIIVASSDFTHYGSGYGYLPFSNEVRKNMYKLDQGAIRQILELDSAGFLSYVNKTQATICGKYPIAVCLQLCKMLGARKGELLKYYTSGDISKDYSNTVGYAAIKIR
jgi:AmmeMemoRadiSam system protein B